MIGPDKCFTSYDLLEYIEMILRTSREQELKTAHQSNYRWLMAKNVRPVNVDADLDELKPLIRKMTSENCASIAVKLDNFTENLSTVKIISTLRNLLEEHHSIQLMAGNVKRVKESKHKVNKVRPLLTEGRRSTVMFVLNV